MPVEIRILALGALLLFIYIFTAVRLKTAQYGRRWNAGPRDEELPAANVLTGRATRAQNNFLETFPIAIVALIGIVVVNRTSETTALGGWIWLGRLCHQHGGPCHGHLAAALRLIPGKDRRGFLYCTCLPSSCHPAKPAPSCPKLILPSARTST